MTADDLDREYPGDDDLMARAWGSPACQRAAEIVRTVPSADTTTDDHRRFSAASKAATAECLERARTLVVHLDHPEHGTAERRALQLAAQRAHLLQMACDLRHPLPGVRRVAARELIGFDVETLPPAPEADAPQ